MQHLSRNTPAMQEKYDHLAVEKSAQQHWSSCDAYRVTEDASKKKFYAC